MQTKIKNTIQQIKKLLGENCSLIAATSLTLLILTATGLFMYSDGFQNEPLKEKVYINNVSAEVTIEQAGDQIFVCDYIEKSCQPLNNQTTVKWPNNNTVTIKNATKQR